MDTSWPVKWDDVFAQARVLDVKWANDDLLENEERAKLRGTSWLKQMQQRNKIGGGGGGSSMDRATRWCACPSLRREGQCMIRTRRRCLLDF